MNHPQHHTQSKITTTTTPVDTRTGTGTGTGSGMDSGGNCCFASPLTTSSSSTSSAIASSSPFNVQFHHRSSNNTTAAAAAAVDPAQYSNNNSSSNSSTTTKTTTMLGLQQSMGGIMMSRSSSSSKTKKARKKPSSLWTTNTIDKADPDAVSSLVASELTQLSLEEREAAYEDLHGVRNDRHHQLDMFARRTSSNNNATNGGNNNNNDHPEAHLDSLIQDVKREINKMRVKTAYDRAVFLCPSFVLNKKFFTMFLRAEDYHVKNTADRIVLHFKHKLELFGIGKLVKRITINDLSDSDLKVIKSGCFHMSPEIKDRSGRTLGVIVQELLEFDDEDTNNNDQHDLMCHVRALWYLFMLSVEEDEEAQLNGFVLVRCSVNANPFDSNHMDYLRRSKLIPQSIPAKIRGYHFCYDDIRLRTVMAAIQLILGKQRRVRFRAHFGSHVECLYSLMGFGIKVESMPFDTNGNHRSKKQGWYDQFIESRRDIETQQELEKEATMAALSKSYNDDDKNNDDGATEGRLILYPRPTDILLGRGRPYQDFPGNLILAKLVQDHKVTYKQSTKVAKTQMTNDIIVLIREEHNGRFLIKTTNQTKQQQQTQQDTTTTTTPATTTTMESAQNVINDDDDNESSSYGYWVEVKDEKVIREKVSHAFRAQTKRSKLSTTSGATTTTTTGISNNNADSTTATTTTSGSDYSDNDGNNNINNSNNNTVSNMAASASDALAVLFSNFCDDETSLSGASAQTYEDGADDSTLGVSRKKTRTM